jgi:hypothetical protein
MFLHVVDDACKNSPPAPSDYSSIAPLWNIENQSGKSPECYYAILYNSELLLILFFFFRKVHKTEHG